MRGNILIVDDEVNSLRLLQEVLTKGGYDVRPCNNSQLALRFIETHTPDLILLDIRMPFMSGFEVCQKIKENTLKKDIPVIFISAAIEIEDKVKGFAVGGSDYITKPFQEEEILARVKTHLTLYRNLQEIKCINTELEKSQERLNMAQTIAGIGNWEWDIAANQVELSEQMQNLLGLTELPQTKQVSFNQFVESVHGQDKERFRTQLLENAKQGQNFEAEYQVLTADNRLRILHTQASCFEPWGKMLGVSQDITERKSHEEEIKRLSESELNKAKLEAEKANLAKSEFLSCMSHEFRTPLNAVLGFAQLLSLDNLTEDQLDNVQAILTAGHHLLDLVNQILDLSKIEADKLDISLEPVNLHSLIENCLTIELPIASKNNITLIDKTSEVGNFEVIVDKLYFKQVLLNLISNAIKYNRANGSVILTADQVKPQTLRINVIDTGYGLSLQQINELFNPFERLGARYSTIEGSGIGLVICKKLIENMSGQIGVESTEGQSCCFWIEIPCV